MSQATLTATIPVPDEVVCLAEDQGVTACLADVLEMTRRVFPEAAMNVIVDDDPEIHDEWHIVVEVMAKNLDVSGALHARYEWHRGLFDCCPAPMSCVFRLGLELTG